MYLFQRKFPKSKWLFSSIAICVLLYTGNNIQSYRIHSSLYLFPRAKTTFISAASSGIFSVLTYNIAGLPEPLSSAVSRRAPSTAEIGRKLSDFDIVHVQEDFNYHDELYRADHAHPFRTPTKGAVPLGDGLNTLSKFPISELRRIPWTDCTGTDCLTPKGFSFSRIEITAGVYVDFYNVHANAANYPSAAAARCKNMLQLAAFIKKYSARNAVVVMGDFNAHYEFGHDNVQQLLTENGLCDAWLLLYRQGGVPLPKAALPDEDILHLTDSTETIDKILFRNSTQVMLKPMQYGLEKRLFSNRKGQPLSDHHPVNLQFQWSLTTNFERLTVK